MHILMLLLCAGLAAAQHNPVLPGDHPDPSVIRVGNEYWATATTASWAPLFPLLKSKDLRTWKQMGSVFPQRPEWAETNFWAPEIAAHKGRYFIYYTAKKRGGGLCVAVADAARPGGPYTDHGPMVCQDAGSIDAVATTDEAGQRWLVWKEDGNSRKQPTPLWAQRLSSDGLKLEGDKQELFHNDAPWEGNVVEGPFLLKRDGWWYLFYSGAGCCGRQCNYALGVARSKKLLGPWEKNPANPILKANEDWSCPGHGSIVDDKQGRMWLLYHAYHSKDSVLLGRQGLLDEIVWGPDAWPVIKGPSLGPYPKLVRIDDDFKGALGPEWSWPAGQRSTARTNGGWLELAADEGGFAVIGRSPTAADYTVVTSVDTRSLKPLVRAGISAYGNRGHAIALTVDAAGKLNLQRREKGDTAEIAAADGPSVGVLHLRMAVASGTQFRFAWSADGKRWTDIGSTLSMDAAVRMALVVTGENGSVARFGHFGVEPPIH